MDRRGLVGRRYEDFLRHGINIDLTPEEYAWRCIVADPRYSPLLERRQKPRRIAEETSSELPEVSRSWVSILFQKFI